MVDNDDNRTKPIRPSEFNTFTGTHNVSSPPCLFFIAGNNSYIGKKWDLIESQYIIGRAEPAQILIEDSSLSKKHASISIKNNQIYLTDLNSTNKTYVDGIEIPPNEPLILKNNCQITFGKLVFKFIARGLALETLEKDRMQKELEFAKFAQSGLYPQKSEVDLNGILIVGRFRSASECCGDWWWWWTSGLKTFVIIADATGHGASAALATSIAHTTIKTLESDQNVEIDFIYQKLNEALFNGMNGVIRMSAIIFEINPESEKIRIINASHPLPLKISSYNPPTLWKDIEHLHLNACFPLGSNQVEIQINELPLTSGERFILYTDGLVERKDQLQREISLRKFSQIVLDSYLSEKSDTTKFIDLLLNKSDEAVLNSPQEDDITVVVIDT